MVTARLGTSLMICQCLILYQCLSLCRNLKFLLPGGGWAPRWGSRISRRRQRCQEPVMITPPGAHRPWVTISSLMGHELEAGMRGR